MTGLRVDWPKTDLTLSAWAEVPRPSTLSRTDPHAVCRTLALPSDRRRGDFWSKVYRTECCWLWARARLAVTGYGAAWRDGRVVGAHRVAYEDAIGPIPAGLDVMHSCDVRHCVRPDHLRAGTRVDNQRDMVTKGRNGPQHGEYNHHAKYTWAQIHAIRDRRRQGESRQALAAEFGTPAHYIYSITSERVWPESICPVHGSQAAA